MNETTRPSCPRIHPANREARFEVEFRIDSRKRLTVTARIN